MIFIYICIFHNYWITYIYIIHNCLRLVLVEWEPRVSRFASQYCHSLYHLYHGNLHREQWVRCAFVMLHVIYWTPCSRGCTMTGNFLLIYICNFHVLSPFLLIYICKLHWIFIDLLGVYNDRQCHVNDLSEVLRRAATNGLERLIITGTSAEESAKAHEFAEQVTQTCRNVTQNCKHESYTDYHQNHKFQPTSI